jgi:tRNA modification GTPase
VRWLRDPESGELLDEALVLAFRAPASFTGEDVIELHIHGSVAACRSVLCALGRCEGVRMAEAGEFTRRAFVNGRLDLLQVEALGDLILAETAAQQRQALGAVRGRVAALAQSWARDLVRALAIVEAMIDFADEELSLDVLKDAREALASAIEPMKSELAGSRVAERLRDGFEVALVGAPNVGKSTLLNAIAGREAALTSATAGTTRDVIEVRLDLEGLPLTMLDMAGLRSVSGEIEAMGIARARKRASAADLRVFLVEAAEDIPSFDVAREPEDLVVLSKADLRGTVEGAVSGLTGAGIDGLLVAVTEVLSKRVARSGSLSHERQRVSVERACGAALRAGAELLRSDARLELAAEDIRAALRALDFLVGKVDVEAVLDVIFASFCLGK